MRMIAKSRYAALLLALLLPLLAACGGSTPASAPNSAPASAAPTAMAEAPTTAAGAPTTATSGGSNGGKLTLAGSSALLPLLQEAATQFQAKNPDAQITVTAGGSGAGRTQVCQGKIDIGNSDVKLSDKEKTDLSCADAVETAVAIQAFAPVANKTGPGSASSLTKQQLADIFSGDLTNWKDVGGDDQAIVLINRAKGSGTRSQMARFLFSGDDTQFATGASEEDNSETVKTTISQTPGAISYLSFAYVNDPSLEALGVDGTAPTKENIQGGKWPIGGPGYMITKGAPQGVAKAFIDFVTGPFQNDPVFDKLGIVALE
jgi:phosphate transport system substrate-binding protein